MAGGGFLNAYLATLPANGGSSVLRGAEGARGDDGPVPFGNLPAAEQRAILQKNAEREIALRNEQLSQFEDAGPIDYGDIPESLAWKNPFFIGPQPEVYQRFDPEEPGSGLRHSSDFVPVAFDRIFQSQWIQPLELGELERIATEIQLSKGGGLGGAAATASLARLDIPDSLANAANANQGLEGYKREYNKLKNDKWFQDALQAHGIDFDSLNSQEALEAISADTKASIANHVAQSKQANNQIPKSGILDSLPGKAVLGLAGLINPFAAAGLGAFAGGIDDGVEGAIRGASQGHVIGNFVNQFTSNGTPPGVDPRDVETPDRTPGGRPAPTFEVGGSPTGGATAGGGSSGGSTSDRGGAVITNRPAPPLPLPLPQLRGGGDTIRTGGVVPSGTIEQSPVPRNRGNIPREETPAERNDVADLLATVGIILNTGTTRNTPGSTTASRPAPPGSPTASRPSEATAPAEAPRSRGAGAIPAEVTTPNINTPAENTPAENTSAETTAGDGSGEGTGDGTGDGDGSGDGGLRFPSFPRFPTRAVRDAGRLTPERRLPGIRFGRSLLGESIKRLSPRDINRARIVELNQNYPALNAVLER